MFVVDYISRREKEFSKVCSKNHVSKLYAFGSSVSNKFDAERSDIDLLVEINEADPVVKGSLLLDFLEDAELFFGRRVDMLTDQPIKNKILAENIERTKVLIYDREKQKVPA
ncbi:MULTISPECIES: nucleotidyltransferase family protein [unclassified Imperialibacter]|uniref:nucleotidyltransferase family protein n=1 Tax=unclassified Imperialibacter TaxID=2629706 RepID=UPI00125613F6|nr:MULTISPECIES: nucleotidyltransferase domain-containing protein [unclassified Imperialibacter]CAD5278516.1 DNA polymerase subunit beta [Imperialibacter sp. 89]CAD5292651.1 DNA polymerase subunit beta [Imperialibacter sp. 75]VVS99571.1 DNA polymerase subunit beta [Imperialibacter sp. EC-SDR9]